MRITNQLCEDERKEGPKQRDREVPDLRRSKVMSLWSRIESSSIRLDHKRQRAVAKIRELLLQSGSPGTS